MADREEPNREQLLALALLIVTIGAGFISYELFQTGQLSGEGFRKWVEASPEDPKRIVKLAFKVAGALLLLLELFKRWGWRYLRSTRLAPRPLLHGTWRATITPTVSSSTQISQPELDGFMVCRQKYNSLRMSLLTKGTTSSLLANEIIWGGDGYEIVAVYHCEPAGGALVDGSNNEHNGAMLLCKQQVTDDWFGTYFMDRELRVQNHLPSRGGALRLTGRINAVYRSYQEADTYFAPPSPTRVFGGRLRSPRKPSSFPKQPPAGV